MASTSEIKKGICIDHNHDIYKIVDFMHVKPGKGAAFVRTTLKSVTTGRQLEQTFPSGHKIDIVRVERREFQYLYTDDSGINFMNTESYDQITLQPTAIDRAEFLKEGMTVHLVYHAEKDAVLTADLPMSEWYEITYTEPGLRGDTATNTLKPAKIETGAEVRVPLFINVGDVVKINLETGDYIERKK